MLTHQSQVKMCMQRERRPPLCLKHQVLVPVGMKWCCDSPGETTSSFVRAQRSLSPLQQPSPCHCSQPSVGARTEQMGTDTARKHYTGIFKARHIKVEGHGQHLRLPHKALVQQSYIYYPQHGTVFIARCDLTGLVGLQTYTEQNTTNSKRCKAPTMGPPTSCHLQYIPRGTQL